MSASVIRYRKLVTTDVASQPVNLAESGTMGHRVQIPISVDDLNKVFMWDRPVGSDRPVGHFKADTLPFDTILSNSLSKVYTDVDGIINGLNFSSAILDANNDSRVRKGGNVVANDLVMCYVIYKCYGSSSAPTEGVVYNLQDAHDMLSNGALVSAIHTSMANEESLTNNAGLDKGSIDAMFRDLLAADPSRFFDAGGRQIPGLFETVANTDARGSWCFVENDKIEIAVQMRFVNAVTRRAVGEGEDTSETVVIPAGSTFKIRLQLVATDTPVGAAVKQEVLQANTSAEIAAQAEATAKAAANAASAQRSAAQAVSAAAAQSAAVQARYQKAVNDNARQVAAVAKAQAALQVAQNMLNQAILSGKQSDIQNQRAAAVAAQALVDNLEAIYEIAAADLQNAKLAADSATATLAASQTAAATAAARLAEANATAALAAKKKADDIAEGAAVSKASKDAESDPLTKDIKDREDVLLDPQTLVNLDAAKNAITAQRLEAHAIESVAQANQSLATQKYNILRYTIDHAISIGKSDSEIQVLRSQLSRALAEKTRTDLEATASQSTLTAFYNSESRALSTSLQAKKDAAILSASSTRASINETVRKLNIATTSFAYASTLHTDALDAANQAQATLDSRIAGGATFNEVQTRRKAVLDAKSFLAEREAALATARGVMVDCQTAVAKAEDIWVDANKRVSSVNIDSEFTFGLYRSSMNASASYQSQRLADASSNQLKLDVTNALIQLNIAKDKSASANAVYSMARRNLDAALAGGKRLSEIAVLQGITQDAQLEQQRSDVLLKTAEVNYNKYVPNSDAAEAILNSAAEFQSTQVGRAHDVTKAILYNSTLAFYIDASTKLTRAHAADDVMLKNLDAAITGGLPLAQTTILRNQKVDASNIYAKAMADFNTASAAMSTVQVDVTENPNVATILYSAGVLRESEIATARTNELIRLANNTFTELIAAAYDADFQYQNVETLKDILANSLANGKNLKEIEQLQESLRNATIQRANALMKSDQLVVKYSQVTNEVSNDVSLMESLIHSYNVWNNGTVYMRASQNIQDFTTTHMNKNKAQSDLASLQAEYDVVTELSLTAQRQGKTFDEMADITSTMNAVQRELANKTVVLSLANQSLSTAKGNWATIKNHVFTYDTASSVIQTQEATYEILTSTLTRSVDSLDMSISQAKSNMLTKNLTQTYIDMLHISTVAIQNNKMYESLKVALDTAIEQGQKISQIQELRLKLQRYSEKRANDSTDLTNTTAAYQSSLQIAAQSQDAKGILDVVAQMQNTVLEGARSNELLQNLIDAKNKAYDLTIQHTAAQSEYRIVESALQIATENHSISQEIIDAIFTAGSKLATMASRLHLANTAVTQANILVNMNPNVQTLQDLAKSVNTQQNKRAEANILANQFFVAKAADEKAYADLDLAQKSYDIATEAFDRSISSGAGIHDIKDSRDSLNVAASKLYNATLRKNRERAALNTALINANLSQNAIAFITTARVTDENVVAGANVTTEQYKLDLLKEKLTQATTSSTASNSASLAAKNLLDSGSTEMTEQEIVLLRENATSFAETAYADMETMRNLQKKVLDQQDLVDKYTVVYQGTQAALAQNEINNFMLFNGFSFQQSINRFILNKDRVPTVTEGVEIVLYSQSFTPIDIGVYSDTTPYFIGNIVTYPDDSGAKYMCLVGRDPRDPVAAAAVAAFSAFSDTGATISRSSLLGKNPVANPIAWIKTEEAQFRYRSTDFMIANVSASNYSATIPLVGDLAGLKTLFLNSDLSGNNRLLHGLTVFGNAVPTSIPTTQAIITNTSYVSEGSSGTSGQTYAFVAMSTVADGLFYSVDGLNWTNIQNASLVNILNRGTDFIQKIYSNGSMWIGIGNANIIAGVQDQSPIIYSTDGLNWYLADISACATLRQILIRDNSLTIYSVKWINTKWLATYYYVEDPNAEVLVEKTLILQSVDGIQWTELSTIHDFNITHGLPIQIINNKPFLLRQSKLQVAYSSDNGTTWSLSPESEYLYPISFAGNNTTLVACAYVEGAYNLVYSTDLGISWNRNIQITNLQEGVIVQDLNLTVIRILFVNNIFIASVQAYNTFIGDYYHGSIMTSTDGITWTFRGPRNTYATTPLKWNEQSAAAAKFALKVFSSEDGEFYLLTSNDGITWTMTSIPPHFEEGNLRDALHRSIGNDSIGWNRFELESNAETTYTRDVLYITISKPLINNGVLYIKNGKTIVDAAVLSYNLYMTNLVAAGFTPVTTLGKLTTSFMNRSILPTTITRDTPFSLGTTTIIPTAKGLYSPTTSYTTGDLIVDSYGSVYMCTVGPDSRGINPVSLGNAPIESPGSSIFWYTVRNNSWGSLVYSSFTDLVLTPVAFGTGTITWTSEDFPPNSIFQLPSTLLNGYTLFGTGVFQRNTITQLSYTYDGPNLCYVFTQGETLKDTSLTFFVKNGKSALQTATVSIAFNTLSGMLASAASYIGTLLSVTTLEDANTTNTSLLTLQSMVVSLEEVYLFTILQPLLSFTRTLIDECVKATRPTIDLLNFYLIAIEEGVPGQISELQTWKDTAASYMATIATKLTTISEFYLIHDLVNSRIELPYIQAANISLEALSINYNSYFTLPTQIGYTTFDTKNTSEGNYGFPMGTSLRAYIETPTQSNLWNIGTDDYTLEFITIAGNNVNSSGMLVDRFAQPIPGTILMGLNTSDSVPFALANWGAWRGLLGVQSNTSTWGPLYTSSDESATSGTYMPDASNYYNFGSFVQNHYCEVRKDNVQTVYLNGNQIMQYSNVYSALSNPVIPGNSAYWQIGGEMLGGTKSWVGGLRNIRLSKEAVYTSSFNTSSIIQGSDSVFYKNLECLSTTILLMPMNNGKLLKDYSLSQLRVSTMGFSSNINSNIKYLSSFGSPSSFTSLAITPVCFLPFSTNTSNLGSDGFAPVIRGSLDTFLPIDLRSGLNFVGNSENLLSIEFNPTPSLTLSLWYYSRGDGAPFALFGNGTPSKIGEASYSENRTTSFHFNSGQGLTAGAFQNDGLGGPKARSHSTWNHMAFVITMNSNSSISGYSYMNGVPDMSNTELADSNSSIFTSLSNMNRITLGNGEQEDGTVNETAFNGLLKNVMVFNTPLTKSQILSLYTEQLYSDRSYF